MAAPERELRHEDARGELLEALAPVAIAPARSAALRARVLAAAAAPEPVIVRAGEHPWLAFLPGVKLKPLRVDRGARTQTSLWRLEAGATIPPHDHAGEEECLVLEGSVDFDGKLYVAGDYLLAPPGLHHTEFVSPAGAVLMIRSELTGPIDALFRSAGF
ncbi:MAG TPA: cupin domain-containing protein [Xanthomonadales bacterium]|nr:cupin domain-containing protein [Xanthomonadales bacterium]